MDQSQYGYQGQYSDQYAQQQQYQTGIPQIRNPFAPTPQTAGGYASQSTHVNAEEEAQLAQWNSLYAPSESDDKIKDGKRKDVVPAGIGPRGQKGNHAEKPVTVVRKGGGTTWQDDSLLEWDPTQFRIMVGNLAGEVTDDSLAKAFSQYGVAKARVIRDKRSQKSKGFGFVSFTDGELGFKAAREMVGKYIGSHPVTIQRSKTDLRPVAAQTHNKHKHGNKDKKNKDRSLDPLRASTGAHIEKKPVRNPAAFKVIG